jgi:hypothetical protein
MTAVAYHETPETRKTARLPTKIQSRAPPSGSCPVCYDSSFADKYSSNTGSEDDLAVAGDRLEA